MTRAAAVGPPPPSKGVREKTNEEGHGQVGANHVLNALLHRRRRAESFPTRRFALASRGIVGAVQQGSGRCRPNSPRDGRLLEAFGSPPAPTYAARTKKLIAMSCCARRSANAEPERPAPKRQMTTKPATASIRLSAPNPMRAMDEAVTPAARAMANSMKCQPIPPQQEPCTVNEPLTFLRSEDRCQALDANGHTRSLARQAPDFGVCAGVCGPGRFRVIAGVPDLGGMRVCAYP